MSNLEYSDEDRRPSPQVSDEGSRVPFNYNDAEKYFRHKTYRPGQRSAILETIEAFKQGKKFVVGEFPTGLGKSDMGKCMADAATLGLTLRQLRYRLEKLNIE